MFHLIIFRIIFDCTVFLNQILHGIGMKVKYSKLVWTCGLPLKKGKKVAAVSLFPHAYLFIALVSLSLINFSHVLRLRDRSLLTSFSSTYPYQHGIYHLKRELIVKSLNNQPYIEFKLLCQMYFVSFFFRLIISLQKRNTEHQLIHSNQSPKNRRLQSTPGCLTRTNTAS